MSVPVHARSPEPDRGRSLPRRPVTTGLARVSRALCLAAVAVFLSVGALFHPGTSLLLGAAAASAAWICCSTLSRCCPDELPELPHPWVVASRAGAVPAVMAGAVSLGWVGGLATFVAIGVISARLAGWVAADVGLPQPPQPATAADQDLDSLRGLLATLPLDVLFDEWHATRPGPGHRAPAQALADLRVTELFVDEFSRRDPAGTARWLVAEPGVPPEGYVRGDAPDRDGGRVEG